MAEARTWTEAIKPKTFPWRRVLLSPYFWLALPVAWVIVAYIIYPFTSLIYTSITSRTGEALTLAHYLLFVDIKSTYFLAFLRSLRVAVVVVSLTTMLGIGLAFLFTRFDFPGRNVMYSMAVMPLVLPGFVAAYAYLMLYGRFGIVTRLWNLIATGELGQASIYLDRYSGVVTVQTVAYLPFMFLTISAVMARLDPAMEEAALSLGASRWRIFFKVILPLLAPGIAAGAILVFSSSMADFGTPLFMEYEAFTVSIFKAKIANETNISAAMSVILTLASLAALYVVRTYLEQREYASLGRGSTRPPRKLQGWRRAAAMSVAALTLIVMLLPLGMIIVMSFTDVQHWSVRELLPPYFHIEHYFSLFKGTLFRALRNSLTFATLATLMAVVYGTVVAYLLTRRRFVGQRILDALVTSPYVIPGTVVGVAYIIAFNRRSPFSLGTIWVATPVIIIAALFMRRSAYVIRSVVASFQQMDASVEEAALSLGASWTYAFRRITVPMILPGLVAGGLLCFVTGVAELSTSILLYTSATQTIPITIYQLVYNSSIGQASALGIVQVLVVLTSLIIINRTVGIRSLQL
ncbi:MAG: putative 2-aminoethylphosphonate transport system permease protein PhnV [Anaerolineales bacterium]|nr:putative 2-aminoethylphosphonate transport system permease protein PhnV [Anaerolineales bacterium]